MFRRISKIKVKIAHAAVQFTTLIFALIAVKIAWDGLQEDDDAGHSEQPQETPNRVKRHGGHSHAAEKGKPVHLASLHSWIGFATIILFIAQVCFPAFH